METGFLVRTENMPDSHESRAYYQTETLKKRYSIEKIREDFEAIPQHCIPIAKANSAIVCGG